MHAFNKYDAPKGDIAVPTVGNSLSCAGCKYRPFDECPGKCVSTDRLET